MDEIANKKKFPEKLSPYLIEKMEMLKKSKGEKSREYQALFLQYKKSDLEEAGGQANNLKHYEAAVGSGLDGRPMNNVERLYKSSIVVEITPICAAHCRYCLRANYDLGTLKEKELQDIARYCGSRPLQGCLREVLITGGDALIIPQRLNYFVEALLEFAPNVKIIRIATRIPAQDPRRIDNNVFNIFKDKPGVRFELATQINHPVEFFPEAAEVFKAFFDLGVRVYSQNVLLKGVNDDLATLGELYDRMRECRVDPHYLFHCVPMMGFNHLRTSVAKGLELAKGLANSGIVSGREKPMFAAMTDIGKITFYHGAILRKDKQNRILLQSAYRYEDRMKWNSKWRLPKTAEIDDAGFLRVWYLDGEDGRSSGILDKRTDKAKA